MSTTIESLREAIARWTGKKVQLRYFEDMACVLMSFSSALVKTAEESVDEAWERNR